MSLKHIPRIFAALLVTASASTLAIAQPPTATGDEPHGRQMHGEHMRSQFAALGLSDAQKEQLKALRAGTRDQNKQARAAELSLRESLHALSPSQPNYTQEVDRIATLLGQAQADRIRAMSAQRAKVWAMLTPSQQAQWAAMPKPDFKKMRRDHRK